MKKWILILSFLLPLLGCVGQKDDPEPDPTDNPGTNPEPGTQEGGEYLSRSLVLDFTGTWCVNCPKMHTAIREAQEKRPGRIVCVSVHCLSIDEMALSGVSDNLVKRFGVSAYPSAVVDLEPSSLFSTSSADLLLSHCDRLLAARGPSAGVSVKSALNGDALDVQVEATAVRDGNYSLHLVLLEDGVVAPQTGGSDNYVHNDVLRAWLDDSAAHDSVHAGDKFSASFKLSGVGPSMRMVALVCRQGLVDGAVSCKAGETIDYQYEQQ